MERWGLLGFFWWCVGFERDGMEERWICQRQRLTVNGSNEGVGHLLLVLLAM